MCPHPSDSEVRRVGSAPVGAGRRVPVGGRESPRRADEALFGCLRFPVETRIASERGPDPEPVRPRRRPAPARARRPRRAAARLRRRARARRARPARALDRADRAARRRQDGAAQRAALGRRPRRLGHRQARGPARPGAAPPARRGAAPGGARARPPARATTSTTCSACIKAFAQRDAAPGAKLREQVEPGHRRSGRHRPRRLRRHRDRPRRAVHRRRRARRRRRQGRRGLHRRDAGPRPRRRLGAVRGLPRDLASRACRVIVVGAGLPHLPAVLSASKSYSERLFRYSAHRPARPRDAADRALVATGRGRGRRVRPPRRSTRCMPRPAATRTSSRPTARSSGTSRPRSPITAEDVARRRARGGGRARGRLLRLPLRAGDARASASTCGPWRTPPS